MPTIQTSDGTEIFYQTYGHGTVSLVFLHGLGGGASEIWNGVTERLDPKRFRAICPDFRGQGKSGRPADGYSWDNFRSDILAVADHAEAATFIPVGLSFGGKLAYYLAAKNPKRVPAQVLVAPVAPAIVPLEREAGLQLCRDAADWQRTKPFFKSLWFGAPVSEDLVDACCKSVANIPTPVLEAGVEMALWTSLAAEIGRLDLPTLLAVGEHDPTYGMAYQQTEMLPFLNQSTLAMLRSGHFIPLEQPIELAQFISQFVAENG